MEYSGFSFVALNAIYFSYRKPLDINTKCAKSHKLTSPGPHAFPKVPVSYLAVFCEKGHRCWCDHYSFIIMTGMEKKRTKIKQRASAGRAEPLLGSLSNHDDDGNKNPTNLHMWQWKTGFLHALHEHFSAFDILKTFSFFLRRQMTCFAVVWTTWAYDDKCSILSYVPSADSNLIPGYS